MADAVNPAVVAEEANVQVPEVNTPEVQGDMLNLTEPEVVDGSNEPNTENVDNISYQQIIKRLIANGCKRISNIKVKNVNATECDNYTRMSFTLKTPIDGFVSDDGGVTYHKGKTNIIYTSLYAIAGAMKEDEDLGWMANHLVNVVEEDAGKAGIVNALFNDSTLTIIQQEFAAGQPVTNPFSSNPDDNANVYDHDVIVNNVIGIKLGKIGNRAADRLMDKMLGY